MATVSDPDGYTNVRKAGEVIATVKNGERFLAAEPSEDKDWWRVYLKSGIEGYIP